LIIIYGSEHWEIILTYMTNTTFKFSAPTFILYMLLSATFLFMPLKNTAQTGIEFPELKIYDSSMLNIISKYKLAGGQMAITYQGRLVYNRGFGYADTATKELVQPESIFRLASASKSITSIALMHLYEIGKINLDAIVLGPNGIINDSQYFNAIDPRMHQFTVRQLMNHSAGFNYDFANEPLWKTYDIAKAMGVAAPTFDFEVVLEWTIKNKSLGFKPGTSSFYSNFGYTLLGLVIKKVTNMPYETYVKDSILKPLGITDMHAGRTLKKDKFSNEVSYYDYAGAPLSPSIYTGIPNSVISVYGGYNWEVMTPAGGWVAAAKDLCKLLTAVDGTPEQPDILSKKTIDTMTTKSVQWPKYGLGWFVNPTDIYHTGGIQGTATVIRIDKSNKLTFSILFNALPQDYAPLYNDFINLATDKFKDIKSWPTVDLFKTSAGNRDNNFKNNVLIYPNPVNTELNISQIPMLKNGIITLFNALGETKQTYQINDTHFILSLSDLAKGLYYITIHDDNSFKITQKITKN
jgi:CubicO group peptidase (beta-lactamase class C family)